MVEEILEEMEATPGEPAPVAKEAGLVMEAKESLEISDAEPAGDFKESDTVFKSTFDSYEFKVPDREEALIECRNCGDLIPYDSKVCPLCDFELSGGGPAQAPKQAPEPAPRPPEPVQEAPRPPRPPRVKRERPNLVALHEARKKREQAIRFRPKRLFAGIHRINKLIKCPKCGSPVAVPSSVRPILVSCTGCGSFGRLK